MEKGSVCFGLSGTQGNVKSGTRKLQLQKPYHELKDADAQEDSHVSLSQPCFSYFN